MSTTEFLSEYRGKGPLRNVTVLDFTQMMMGPVATQLLGDLGAVVIKVERPVNGEWERSYMPRGRRLHGESPYFLAMNRNKLAVTADLNDEADRSFLFDLVKSCDVVVENFRPGVMDKLGFGYDDLVKHNPRLVYASGSGFGAEGPLVKRPGQDMLLQSMSGLAANSGPGNGPPVPVAAPILDASTGFLLSFAIASAVLDARENGTPRQIEASLLGTSLMIQCQEALVSMNTDLTWERSSSGIAAPWTDAPYGVYQTRDGFMAMSMTPRAKLAEIFALDPSLVACTDDEWFLRRDEINAILVEKLRTRTSDEWIAELTEKGMWVAPVQSVAEMVRHPQVEANGYVEAIDAPGGKQVQAVGLPFRISGVHGANRLPVPTIGQHDAVVRQALAGRKPQG
ncbi:CaiB/BaiF CoA transferase family protein [Methylobacterium nodulans]|uniref:L-carnitine dehydratase/bile acid-inducible protein F n=1 Tax=Methylobacterium nodulans (strain LMG 21967 / CNCM I-2342 / ORS 2060) TaxID=460265 RepID=B8IXF5_METNO|nr:CoA transferase [Methylobacterium nodulans]ACL63196.1 L-carnitine dehydratase/bile acid-inducible protein F [Methylobacterium nodulans ORS 2060]